MTNAKYDFAPGKFTIMEVGQDGPERLQGHQTYDSHESAARAAERYLREERSHGQVTVFRVETTYHLDPLPKLMSNAPEGAI